MFAAGKELIFLDPRNGELLGVMRPAGNHSAALSADGRLVATMRGGSGDVLLTEATALMLDGIDALVTKLAPGATIASPTDVLENAKGKAVIAGVPATPNNPPVAPPPRVIPDPLATRIRSDTPPAPPPPPAVNPPATPAPVAIPRAVPPVAPTVTNADRLAGTWRMKSSRFDETWTIAREGDKWRASAVYTKNGAVVGSCHGDNVRFHEDEIAFTRTYEMQPAADLEDHVAATIHLKNTHAELSVDAGGGKRFKKLLERVGAK